MAFFRRWTAYFATWSPEKKVTGTLLAASLTAVVVTDQLNGPAPAPGYLTGILGAASTAFFAVVTTDKSKTQAEIADDAKLAKTRATTINDTAVRTEAKADQISETLKRDRPDLADQLPDSLLPPKRPASDGGGDPT